MLAFNNFFFVTDLQHIQLNIKSISSKNLDFLCSNERIKFLTCLLFEDVQHSLQGIAIPPRVPLECFLFPVTLQEISPPFSIK